MTDPLSSLPWLATSIVHVPHAWFDYLISGAAVLIWGLMLFVSGRLMMHGGSGRWLIGIGGLTAGIAGLASQIMGLMHDLGIFRWLDEAQTVKLLTAWNLTGYACTFAQVILWTGLFVFSLRFGGERRRIAELEAIINDRDSAGTP